MTTCVVLTSIMPGRVVSEFVEVEVRPSLKSTAQVQLSHIPGVQGEEAVDVNINSDNDLGTIYSVSIPVRRVKPAFDMNEMADAGIDASWEDDEEPAGAKKEPATKSP